MNPISNPTEPIYINQVKSFLTPVNPLLSPIKKKQKHVKPLLNSITSTPKIPKIYSYILWLYIHIYEPAWIPLNDDFSQV